MTLEEAAAEALRRSEEPFRLLVEAVQDYAIFMLTPEGVIASWNAGAQRIKGYAAEEVVGRHFRAFYPAEKQAAQHPEHELELALRDGRYEEEGWRVRKDGSQFWADVVITGVHDEAGVHIGFAKVSRDMTERRQMLDHLESVDRTWLVEHTEGFVLKDSDLEYLVKLLESVGRQESKHAWLDLVPEVQFVAAARRFLFRTLTAWGVPVLYPDAVIVVSELVTNAITHAPAPGELRLSLLPDVLRISVTDSGTGAPEPRQARATREGGRGLYLVDALTSAWGMEPIPDDGKIVWAELTRRPASR